MTAFISAMLALLAVPATLWCAYLLVLTLLSFRLPAPKPRERQLRFDVVVPAHDEESGIERTVRSLLRMDWPAERFRVFVVADNCTDATAAVARSAGATVLERTDATRRGKGFALRFAFDQLLQDGRADAIAVVDADAEVSANFLEAFAARIERGERALQARNMILNPWASWRTQLLTIAVAAFHIVRSRARERLGLSCGVRGNGWCVTSGLLREHPYQYYSLAEDLEYGIALGLAQCRVAYVDEACSNAEMVSSERIARTQRQRWEQGRLEIVRTHAMPLLIAAARARSAICLDLAFDLLLLPLSYVAISIAVLIAASAAAGWLAPELRGWIWWSVGCAGVLVLHVLRGWQVSGLGLRGLAALARVPGYILWKFLVLFERKTTEWIRTERERT